MNIDEREEEEDSVTSSESISSTYNTSDPIGNLPSVSNSEDSSQNRNAGTLKPFLYLFYLVHYGVCTMYDMHKP